VHSRTPRAQSGTAVRVRAPQSPYSTLGTAMRARESPRCGCVISPAGLAVAFTVSAPTPTTTSTSSVNAVKRRRGGVMETTAAQVTSLCPLSISRAHCTHSVRALRPRTVAATARTRAPSCSTPSTPTHIVRARICVCGMCVIASRVRSCCAQWLPTQAAACASRRHSVAMNKRADRASTHCAV
jgi:hypothetical protein